MQKMNKKLVLTSANLVVMSGWGIRNMAHMAKSLLHGQMDKNVGRGLTE